MPEENNFRHQSYTNAEPKCTYSLLAPSPPPKPSTEAFENELASFANLVSGKVDTVYLIHGTFSGNDALGWVAQLEKKWPSVGDPLRWFGKKIVDYYRDDEGNFTQSYAQLLKNGFAQADNPLTVRFFNWSSENTHTGRCRAAIEFLACLLEREKSEKQIQCWCHSHAGNVLALVTNIIASNANVRNDFFEIVRPMFSEGVAEKVFTAVADGVFEEFEFDIFTFGTPIRYGWDENGFRDLLHFVHHRPAQGSPDFLAVPPKISKSTLQNLHGDIVHQVGIAGTNFFPYVFDRTLMQVETALNEFLEPNLGRLDVWERIQLGMRVPESGTTLLVDYESADQSAKEGSGHSIYTRIEWLPFHTRKTVELIKTDEPNNS